MFDLIDLPPKSVEYMIDDDVIMIDIRREDEWKETGLIRNSYKLTFFDEYGNHDVFNWIKKLEKIVTSKDATIILICAHANRTRVVGNYLIQEQGYSNVTHLKGGIALWIEENRPLEKYE